MRAPTFTQIRPQEPDLARVERNVATALEGMATLLNGGLTLRDNAAGALLPERELTLPLTSPEVFTLGKGRTTEPTGLVVVCLKAGDGTCWSGGPVQWRFSTTQAIGSVEVLDLPGTPDGTYSATFFVVGG